jgi:hypothetical protein
MKLFAKKEIELCRSLLPALLLLPLLLAGGPAFAHSKSSPSPGASATPTPPKFDVPIPVDHVWKGVDFPFSSEGKLQYYFVIRKAFRVDPNHLDMTSAYVQTYDDKQVPDITVYMAHCVLDLNTRVVTSDVPVTVQRTDFKVTGDKLVFNTQTHVGRLTGHVRMIIYNLKSTSGLSSPSPTPSQSPAPQPSAQP